MLAFEAVVAIDSLSIAIAANAIAAYREQSHPPVRARPPAHARVDVDA